MTMAPGFGMEPTAPTPHPARDVPPPSDEPLPPTHQPWSPPPKTGEPELGSRGLRLIAYIFDSLLVAFIIGAIFIVIMFFVAFLPGDPPDRMPIAGATGVLISILYWPFWWSRDGQTPAMMPLGLRVIDEQSEATISFGRAVLRLIVLAIGIAVFFLGVLWTLVDKRRRGWHDLAAHTIVIGEK
jgi:uncharacterized RDD family membrane protein YckC